MPLPQTRYIPLGSDEEGVANGALKCPVSHKEWLQKTSWLEQDLRDMFHCHSSYLCAYAWIEETQSPYLWLWIHDVCEAFHRMVCVHHSLHLI